MKKTLTFILLIMSILAGGFFQYTFKLDQYLAHKDHQVSTAKESSMPTKKEKKIMYWVAPMDANYRREKPGKSPMGMELVPVYAESENEVEDKLAVKIKPYIINNLGVRTATVKRSSISQDIHAVGYVAYNENKISHLHTRTKGWVEKLYIKAEGDQVKKGQVVFEMYDPDLVNAQQEFLQILSSKNKAELSRSSAQTKLMPLRYKHLINASEERLIALGISKKDINRLKRTKKVLQRIKYYSPQNGIISKLNVGEGMFVKPSTIMMTIADLSTVWLQTEVFERQSSWVSHGQSVEAKLTYLPDRIWQGEIDYIYPELNPTTRTLKIRTVLSNPNRQLLPNMYAHIVMKSKKKPNVLIIPKEAILRSSMKNRVIVEIKPGQFKPRDVQIGLENETVAEVVSGLEKGETVVTSAQFLIDSEASLKASFARMSALKESPASMTETQHSGAGTIIAILPEEQQIVLTHDPIESLKWLAKVTQFKVKNTLKLSNLKVGDSLHFSLETIGKEKYQISSIHKMDEGGL